MKISDYPKFESALSQGRPIIFLCGAGLSVSLGDHAKGWVGWLKEGKAYLSDVEAEELDRRFGSYSASELIDAASFLIEALRKNGNYTAYMDSTIGSIRVQNKKLANALALFVRCGDYFATTNYDKLLEEVTGLGYYTYNMPGKIVQMLSGQAEMSVIHLHGIYDAATNTDDIVADQKQYEDVIANQGAQFIQNLISTCTLVILGCGATVDDPNLKGFMSFASKQLHLNIPYFYLHKAGDDLSDLGPNVIPICYGMEYSDLSNAVEDMANYRIRTRYRDSGIIRVNPYVKTRKSFTASYRLHYLNEFCKFVGREKELVELNKFCSADKELLWWSLVGKGGIGKSRLVYQWLKQLSNNWFGFFAKTDVDVERYREFKPFSDTVIVIDYVLGNEDKCATIVTTLFERFEYSRFKLRLLFVDRRYQNNENNWYDRIVGKMDMQTRLWFQECSYNNKTTLSPLVISELSEEEELEFIKVYLEAYLNNVADDDTKVKYSSVLPDTADQIYSNFKTALKEKCDRPLFVAVYTELWIYKDGCISVTSLDEMLAAFLKREEDRWLLCLDNHSNLLKDYVKLLALASASVLVCLDDDQGIYQQAAHNLQQYINASQRPGKKQTDFSDLFVYQEYAHDYEMDEVSTLEEIQEEILRRANDPKYLRLDEKGCSKLLTIIDPEYPDIIKEFLVDYYIPKHEWIGFSQAARLGTVTQFDMFLLHAIEDFPDKKSYMEMEFAPLEDERDRFGQWIFVILAAKNLNNFEQIADNLCVSQAPEIICAYEMEVWKDIGIVLTDRGELDRLYTLGLRSADYITDRLDNDVVCECIEEVWDAFFIGVHNAELTQQTANLMDKYNQIADKIAENGYIATWCTENYARLMLLWLRRNDYRSAANCWKQMMKFQQRFADDEDILKAIAGAADALYDIYRENQVPGRRRKLLKDMERIFDETHNADVANALAILEANEHTIYDPPAVFDSNKSEILLSTENKLKEIYEAFPNEGKVVLGYSYLVSWNYVTWLDFPRPIDEELIPLFKKWIRKFPENKLELMEYYSFILFEKWLYMDSLDNISEANKIYYEIKAIADELSKDYADNQVTQMLSMGIVRKL